MVVKKRQDTWNELFVVNWFISIFFCKNTKWKKVSYPHYLKIVIKLSKHGLSYSLKCDPRPISKITFCANLSVKSFIFFSKNCIIFPKLKDYQVNLSNWPHSDQWIADLNNKQQFLFEKFSNLCINMANSPIGINSDFRDWPRMTFETVAEAIFA